MRNPQEIYDEWLVIRCQGNDPDALRRLFEQWHPRLHALATRLTGHPDAADDAVQATWLVIVRRLCTLRDPSAFRAWAFRIAANKCRDQLRTRAAQPPRVDSNAVEYVVDREQDRQRSREHASTQLADLRAAIERLDSARRELLRLHYLEGESVQAIAARLSIPPGTVKSRLHHAREKLKQAIQGTHR